MRRWVQALPASVEFAVVVLGAFGYFIVVSLLAAVWHRPHAVPVADAQLVELMVYELALTALLAGFLWLRGWSFARLGLRFGPVETLTGFALAGAAYLAYVAAFVLIARVWPQAAQAMRPETFGSSGISLASAVALAVVNPVFEELFVCGYVIAALEKPGDTWVGIHVSVAIRLLYHLYQGAVAAIGVVPFGLILALWYARTGRLWPVIVAHAVTDFAALLHYVR
jgi:membrane protease YdiL (CAAX protease family)